MSSPLAIAAVTAILKDLLNEGLINNDLSPVGSFSVTALPPDRINIGETEESRLNLFLYQITPNIGWRNVGQPSRDAAGVQLTNPPLAVEPTTGETHLRHHISPSGFYRGKKVLKTKGD